MSKALWLFNVSVVIVGGLVVVAIVGLLAQKKYEQTVNQNPILGFLSK